MAKLTAGPSLAWMAALPGRGLGQAAAGEGSSSVVPCLSLVPYPPSWVRMVRDDHRSLGAMCVCGGEGASAGLFYLDQHLAGDHEHVTSPSEPQFPCL